MCQRIADVMLNGTTPLPPTTNTTTAARISANIHRNQDNAKGFARFLIWIRLRSSA